MSLLRPDRHSFEEPLDVHWCGGDGGLTDKIKLCGKALSEIVTWRPDVIHVAHVNLSPLAMWLSRLTGARTILNVYGLEVWSNLKRYRRDAMQRMDVIVADCHFTANYVRDQRLYQRRPAVIWDCVDLDRFTPGPAKPDVCARYGIPDKTDTFVILSLGRLSAGAMHKGYERLIIAVAELVTLRQSVRLVIAGRGDQVDALKDRAARLGIAAYVHFTGAVAEDDLVDVYRSASLFSLVSDRGDGRGEGIPLTPLESMSCAVPILVGNHDGSQEAVIGHQNGFVIDPFDKAAHIGRILQVIDNPLLHQSLCKAARQVAVQYFGFDRFLRDHASVYDSLARTCNRGRNAISR